MPSDISHRWLLASASSSVRIWDVSTHEIYSNTADTPARPETQSRVTVDVVPTANADVLGVAWSSDFQYVAAVTGGAVHVYEKAGKLVEVLPASRDSAGAKEEFRVLALGRTTNRNAFYGGTGKVVNVWDRKERKLAGVLEGHKSTISSLTTTVDDSKVASGSDRGAILVHSLKHGTQTSLVTPFRQAVNTLAFSSFKRSMMAAAGDEGMLAFWDINQSTSPIFKIPDAHLSPVKGVSFAPCNRHMYCTAGLDRMLKCYDIQQNKVVREFQTPEPLTSCSLSAEHLMAVGGLQGTVFVFDMRWRDPIVTLRGQGTACVNAVAFQPPPWAIDAAKGDGGSKARRVSVATPGNTLPDALNAAAAVPTAKINGNARVSTLKGAELMDMFSPLASKEKVKITEVKRQPSHSNLLSRLSQSISQKDAEGAVKSLNTRRSDPALDMFSPIGNSSEKTSTGAESADMQDPASLTPSNRYVRKARSVSTLGDRLNQEHASGIGADPAVLAGLGPTRGIDGEDRRLSRTVSQSGLRTPHVTSTPSNAWHASEETDTGMKAPGVTPRKADAGQSNVSNVRGLRHRESEPVIRSPSVSSSTHIRQKSTDSQRPDALEASSISNAIMNRLSVGNLKERIMEKLVAEGVGDGVGGMVGSSEGKAAASPKTPSRLPMPTSAAVNPAGGAHPPPPSSGLPPQEPSSFQYQILQNVVEECLQEFRVQLRNDVQNMHLELLRQFQIQRNEMEELFKQYSPTQAMVAELNALREENTRLRCNY
ncbi:Protein nedd1 [Borealophlyctis nickersoniae]|nr:Protein nedd1 [Borealophlyctis nickersoniae]